MTSTEEKLARELGFRVRYFEPEPLVKNAAPIVRIEDGQPYFELGDELHWKLWRKCLELTEQRERLAKAAEYLCACTLGDFSRRIELNQALANLEDEVRAWKLGNGC